MRASMDKASSYAAEFARKGGNARAAGMTKAERSEAARKAANARWAKKRAVDEANKSKKTSE